MKMESPPVSNDFKAAAFKALLQGPFVFNQFSERFSLSRSDMQEWLDDAGAILLSIRGTKTKKIKRTLENSNSPLTCDERRILLGEAGH